MKHLRLLLFLTLIIQYTETSAQMKEISSFGSNPGDLEMYLFEPSEPKPKAEVVLVLHGCGQSVTNFAFQTGWNVLAERYGFYVIFAQQKQSNNPNKCFNWFLSRDNLRDRGEAKSLVEMVQYVHDSYTTDKSKSFVCGLSAGGSFTPVMMACYPDVFKGGGVWAGVPYQYKPAGNNDLSAEEWGNKARSAYPAFTGRYPTLFICQGSNDAVTDPINENRLVAQWTNLHDTDIHSDVKDDSFQGNPKVRENVFLNNANDTIIKSYRIAGMGHGIAVDPGSGDFQGGETSRGSFDVDFYSTYWMANFFGLIDNDIVHTYDDLDAQRIKAYVLSDGTLQVLNASSSQHLTIRIHDIMGRLIYQNDLKGDSIIPSAHLSKHRIMVVSILDDLHRRRYAKILVRE